MTFFTVPSISVGGVLGRLGRPHGQVAHLVGHHRKPRPGLARPRRLDRGVERQQVGLEGDLVDGLDDLGGLLAGLRDLVHGLGQLPSWTRWPSPTTCLASLIRLSACRALSAFCLVMEDISSSDEEVSSIEAACSLSPSASDWLAEDTWPEAEDDFLGSPR